MQIICLVAMLSELLTIGVVIYQFFIATTIDFVPVHILDGLNCIFFALIYFFITFLLEKKGYCRGAIIALALLNIFFVVFIIYLPISSNYRTYALLLGSFLNFGLEFHIGLHLFNLEDNLYIKNFGLAIFINSLIWILSTAFQYIHIIPDSIDVNLYNKIMSVLDQASCIFIIWTTFSLFRHFNVSLSHD
jgi:hypothetical protein